MDQTTHQNDWTKYIQVTCLMLSLFISNTLYRLFQLFHYSRSPSQKNVINTLYVLLSVIYQLINIHSCGSLIVKSIFPFLGRELANYFPMSCIFILSRVNLLGIMWMTLAVISLLRYLKEFHFKYYQNWPQDKLFLISSILCILPNIITNTAVFILCDQICFFPEEAVGILFKDIGIQNQDFCFLPPTLSFLVGAFTIIFFFNLLPILRSIFKSCNTRNINIQAIPQTIFIIHNTVEPLEIIDRSTPSRNFEQSASLKKIYTVNLPFSTGFLTIIISTFSLFPSLFVNLLLAYYSKEVHPNRVMIGYMISASLTTFLPVFWIYSNTELREFSIRKIKKIYWPILGIVGQYKEFLCKSESV